MSFVRVGDRVGVRNSPNYGGRVGTVVATREDEAFVKLPPKKVGLVGSVLPQITIWVDDKNLVRFV